MAPRGTPVGAPLRCVIAQMPISSADIFLFHKTTRRQIYDERRSAHPEADEVILVNERGELTECSIGNLVVELHGERVTPPRDCGLLAGVFRDELIEQGTIRERVLRMSDIEPRTRLWRISSLREWVEVVMVA
jgi:para-aminobenzoate synthetase/4-amino-4-deoxychorismate lyase